MSGFLETRKMLESGVVGQVSDDTAVAIRIRATASAGTVTSVTVTTGTNIVFVSVDGGTETFAFSTYTTVGALVDAINASANWEAKVLDTVRSEATATQFVTGAITSSVFEGVTVWDVKVDTSAADYVAYRLTYNRGMESSKLSKSHRVHLQEIGTDVTLGATTANGLKVYEVDGSVETVVYQATGTSGSAATVNWASGEGRLSAKDGNDLVVKLTDGTSVTGSLTVVGITE